MFRKRKPRYPGKPKLPLVRRKIPLRYHMKHQFGIGEDAFVQTMVALTGSPLLGGNRMKILRNGDEIFPAMLKAIRSAERTINMETYIYWDGKVAHQFAETLVERARAGVEVKLLMDAVGSGTLSDELIHFMRGNGVGLEFYHPLRWYTLSRANHRTHRKLLIIDGRIGFTGGAGIADEWLGNADAPGRWRETHVQVEGPAVTQMQYAFMDNWVKSRGEILTGLHYFPQVPPAGDQQTQVIKSAPSEGSSAVKLLYIISIVSAKKSILITSAYFIPDEDTLTALAAAIRRGVTVKVIVPGEWTDVPIVRLASRWHYERLLHLGIKIYEYIGTMMHAKTMVVDGLWSTIGSANFDARSFRLNDEVNVNVYDREFATEMEQMFQEDLARSAEVTPHHFRHRSISARVKERLAGLLRPQL